MADKIEIDHYKELVERTKQLHLELMELSSKMGCIVDRFDAELPDTVVFEPSFPVGSGDLPDDRSSSPGSTNPCLKNVLDNDHL